MPRRFGKTMLECEFFNPKTGKTDQFVIYDYKNGQSPSIVFPLTATGAIVAVKQFRYAAKEFVYELPGGVPSSPEDTPKKVAEKELQEETGYEAKEIVLLTPQPIWFEPSSFTVGYWPLLALGCTKKKETQHEDTEVISVVEFSPAEWLSMILKGAVRDSKSIAITYLALIHAGLIRHTGLGYFY